MQKYSYYLDKFKEFGVVQEVFYPIIKVQGLPNINTGEIVIFENEQIGQVIIINEHQVEILILSAQPVNVGMQVARTGKPLTVRVSESYLGGIFDPLGESLGEVQFNEEIINNSEPRIVDIEPLSITQRYQITDALETGISIIDLMIPLGKGQRELIVGDRKTGKTSVAFSTLKNHITSGGVGVYVAIGKQAIEIEAARRWFVEQKIQDKLVIIASSADDPQSLIYISPFTGMCIAEFFRDKGIDVLVVMDDMTNHAKHYREISLIARKFPGRDSYPGDIFFTHARLLERAGNFILKSLGRVSISCLPLVETTDNDLSDYIVSNLIGITDGHILLDSNEFVKGRRPAVNPMLSVTRVGRQTQGALHQEVSQRLISFINDFQQSQKFSHFGSELGSEIKQSILRGELVYQFFNQPPQLSIPLNLQIFMVAMIWAKMFEDGTIQITDLAQNNQNPVETDNSLTSNKVQIPSQIPATQISPDTKKTITPKKKMSEIVWKLLQTYQSDKNFKHIVEEATNSPDWFSLLDAVTNNTDQIKQIIYK